MNLFIHHCMQADPDNKSLSKCLRQDSSSSAESICQSGGSMSSYEADPEFLLSVPQTTKASDHQSL